MAEQGAFGVFSHDTPPSLLPSPKLLLVCVPKKKNQVCSSYIFFIMIDVWPWSRGNDGALVPLLHCFVLSHNTISPFFSFFFFGLDVLTDNLLIFIRAIVNDFIDECVSSLHCHT